MSQFKVSIKCMIQLLQLAEQQLGLNSHPLMQISPEKELKEFLSY